MPSPHFRDLRKEAGSVLLKIIEQRKTISAASTSPSGIKSIHQMAPYKTDENFYEGSATNSRKILYPFKDDLYKNEAIPVKYKTQKDRRAYWNEVFALCHCMQFGKDCKTCLEYEQAIVGKKELIGDNVHSATSLIKKLSWEDMTYKKKHRKNLANKDEGTINSDNYYEYLYIDDVLPATVRPIPGRPATGVDLQAIEHVVQVLSDDNIPFNEKRFTEFLQSKDSESTFTVTKYNVVPPLLEIKTIMTIEDWQSVRDLYIEIVINGVIEVKKVYDTVLEMVTRCYTSHTAARSWFETVSPAQKLSALKLGTMFLNLFHKCYINASEEVQGDINWLKELGVKQANERQAKSAQLPSNNNSLTRDVNIKLNQQRLQNQQKLEKQRQKIEEKQQNKQEQEEQHKPQQKQEQRQQIQRQRQIYEKQSKQLHEQQEQERQQQKLEQQRQQQQEQKPQVQEKQLPHAQEVQKLRIDQQLKQRKQILEQRRQMQEKLRLQIHEQRQQMQEQQRHVQENIYLHIHEQRQQMQEQRQIQEKQRLQIREQRKQIQEQQRQIQEKQRLQIQEQRQQIQEQQRQIQEKQRLQIYDQRQQIQVQQRQIEEKQRQQTQEQRQQIQEQRQQIQEQLVQKLQNQRKLKKEQQRQRLQEHQQQLEKLTQNHKQSQNPQLKKLDQKLLKPEELKQKLQQQQLQSYLLEQQSLKKYRLLSKQREIKSSPLPFPKHNITPF